MKRLWGLVSVLLLLLVCCSTAFAVETVENSYGITFHPIQESEYTVTLPKGLVADVTKDGSTLNIHVDSEATDWETVLANSTNPEWVELTLSGKAPAGETVTGAYAGGAMLSSKADADAAIEFQEWYITDWQSDMMEWSFTTQLGQISPVHSLFVPRNTSAEWPDTLMVCWINSADPTYRYYEWLDVIVTHTAQDAFTVPFRYVTAKTMEPSKDVVGSDQLSITEVQDGCIVYKILSDDVLNDISSVTMRFKAPAKAARACLAAPYSSHEAEVKGNAVTFEDIMSLDPSFFTERTFSLSWYDKDDKLLDYGFFTLYVTTPQDAPWPNYVQDFYPVPANRLSVKNGVANAGITYTYDENIGTLHTSHDGTVGVKGELDQFIVTVTPPEGATYYRMTGEMSWDSGFRGPNQWFMNEVEWNITFNTDDVYPASSNWNAINNAMLRAVEAGPATVYLQENESSRFGGGFSAVYWYASKEDAENDPLNPLRREFVCYTTDQLALTEQTDMVADEAQITSPVKKVICIGNHPWRLKVLHHPQKGERTRHYELQMVNDTGAPQGLDEPVVFYMPYPEGIDPDKEYDYELLHFDSNYRQNVKVDVTATPYGLRFEVSSLSPFVISYDEVIPVTPTPEPTATPAPTATATPTATLAPTAEPTATPTATPKPIDVPKTGDNSPLALLGLLAVLSLAGLMMLGKAKRDNL